MKTIKGDLIKMAINGDFDLIAHGCNCHCTMGAGIAVSVRREFPEAYKADLATSKSDRSKLGTCSVGVSENTLGDELIVVNCYTQYNYGRGKKLVEYDAVRSCMKWIANNYPGYRIGLPLIGCGLAGGDWNIVSKIIEEELDGEDVTIVEYQKG